MFYRGYESHLPFESVVVWDAERRVDVEDWVDESRCDSRQFSHSANVISRSLFWSQYLGRRLPHFLSCFTVDTISRKVFHSFLSQTLFLFLSRITKLRVPILSSSVPQPLVLLSLKEW